MVIVWEDGQVIGEVEYTQNLDFYDGRNYTCGCPGRHKGLAQKSGEYALIHGTQWQGERDYGELISADRAVQEILESGNTELFDEFPDLQKRRESLRLNKKERGRNEKEK